MGFSIFFSVAFFVSICFWGSLAYGPRPEYEEPTASDGPTQVLHPLDPLTATEMRKAIQIVEAAKENNTSYFYVYIALQEPPKHLILPFFLSNANPPLDICPRKAFFVLLQKGTGSVFEAVVNLRNNQRESYTHISNVQPPLTYFNDLAKMEIEVIRANPEIRQRCASLGYPNMDLVTVAPWPIGIIEGAPDTNLLQGKRVIQYFFFGQNFATDNFNAHPLDFIVVMDLDKGTILEIQDLPTHDDFSTNNTGNVAPQGNGNYDYTYLGGESFLRKGDKPITTGSPNGTSYALNGNELKWQKWKMHLGFNGREGTVLNLVSYNDGGKHRPLLYRASIVEMFTPYADPRPPYYRKMAFDLGEVTLGYNADEQIVGEDVFGSVKFIDQVLHNSSGSLIFYKKSISIREEDAGLLWKHVDYRTGKGITTRSHRLAVTLIATLGHYDFAFNWFFYQDGSIQFQCQLTGIPSVNMIALGSTAAGYGEQVAPQINAPYHQHFFTTRLDFEIDGNANSVSTSDVVPLSYPTGSSQNPFGQGFTVNKTTLRTAGEGRTNFSPKTGRTWVISNPHSIHKYTGSPVGWKFMPPNTPPLLAKKDAPLRKRANFHEYDTYVTSYKDDQIYPGGFYLNETGLQYWVNNDPNANVEDTDIVFWNSFNLIHITRPEDWPIMPTESVGFWLKPYNFFLENPSLDVPQYLS